jgi:hypothetical protein
VVVGVVDDGAVPVVLDDVCCDVAGLSPQAERAKEAQLSARPSPTTRR